MSKLLLIIEVCFCALLPLAGQEIASSGSGPSEELSSLAAVAPEPAPIDKRIFGVLPNYRTANLVAPFERLTVKQKFYIGYKDSTDYPIFVLGGFLSGLAQLVDQHPDFGQGTKGYAHRYATATADQLLGNLLTESIMPSLFRQDPRYFRVGQGESKKKRLGYAASRIFVAKDDNGRWGFNYSEVIGNAVVAGIGNAYYPGERKLGDNVQRLYTQLATDAFSQVLKEFWPDIKRKFLKRKDLTTEVRH